MISYWRHIKLSSILLHLCFYIELLTPISQLSLTLQKGEINPVKANRWLRCQKEEVEEDER